MVTLEDGYGINLLPLATFAMDTYKDDPCEEFMPKIYGDSKDFDEKSRRLTAMMHKAITIIQFKEEAAIYQCHPEWNMTDRILLSDIDYDRGTININNKEYKLKSNNFPTIDPSCPYRLTEEEASLMEKLCHSFQKSCISTYVSCCSTVVCILYIITICCFMLPYLSTTMPA